MLLRLKAAVLATLVLAPGGASAAAYLGWPASDADRLVPAAPTATVEAPPAALWTLSPEEHRAETEALYLNGGRPGLPWLGDGGLTTYRYLPGDDPDAVGLAPLVATTNALADLSLDDELHPAGSTSYALVHASTSYALVTPIPAAVALLTPALGGLAMLAWRQRRRDKVVA
jgi:hypothetical protein